MGDKGTTNEAMTEVGEEQGKGGRKVGGGSRKERKKGGWELKRDCKGEKEGRDTLETDNTNHLRKYGRGRVAKKLADQTKKREERAYNKKIGAGCEKDKNG